MYQLINLEKGLFRQTKKARFRFKGKAHKILKLLAVAV